ncbi:MAG: copper resistance CopC/CopD family protein [Solirubrobacteraceae bacterium]
MRRGGLALACALLAALLTPAGAWAHAVLVDASPQRGATLREQPRQVVLHFNETVEGNFGAVQVFDASARRVDDARTFHPGGSGSRLAVGLKPELPDGTYVATYRVISADSHPISGGLVFSIGAPGAAAAPTVAELIGDTSAGPVTQGAFGLARGLDYLATALVLGGLAFLLVVWLPALRTAAGASDDWRAASAAFLRRMRLLLLGATALGVVSGIAGIVLQGATAGATSGWAALSPGVVGDVLGTRFGHVWGARVLAFAVLGGAVALALRGVGARSSEAGLRRVALGADGLAAPGPPRGALALAAVPAAFVALAPALGGHASVQSPVALLFGLDVAHVLAMSAWIGGLVVLLTALPAATRRLAAPDRTRLLAAALVRFSAIALGCVVVLLVTGTVQSVVHIGSWSAVLETGFGRAVVVKVVLLAVLVALGAVNRRRVVPALRRLAEAGSAPGAAGHLLRRTLRAEVALVVAVLGVTAALVSYPPPESLAGGPFGADATLGPLRLEVTMDPARVGPNELHLYLLRANDGTPFHGTKELTVALSLPDKHIGPLPATARDAGPGHYVVDTVQLVPAGDWRLDVTSRVSAFDQYETSLKVPVR